jgi:hypothetical protein
MSRGDRRVALGATITDREDGTVPDRPLRDALPSSLSEVIA